jgi:hypothetical protein
MILELITPLMLATSPMTLLVEPNQYNHGQQISKSVNGEPLSWTASGTQTYGPSGRPSDSDND